MSVLATRTDPSLRLIAFGGFLALLAFALIAAYGAGSSARAKSNEVARQHISADHAAVCDKLGLARTTSEQAACIGELHALMDRHEAIFATRNESLL